MKQSDIVHPRRGHAWLALTLCLTAACAAQDPSPPPATDKAAIRTLIGDAACEADAQCKTIAIGAKACGGPEGYLAWSTAHTDGAALERAADSYAAERRREIAARREVSTCSVQADPGAYCAAGTCRLRSGGGGSRLVR